MTGGPLVVMLAMLFMQYGWRIWIVSVATPFIMYIFLMGVSCPCCLRLFKGFQR